jgi:hypothetical protein
MADMMGAQGSESDGGGNDSLSAGARLPDWKSLREHARLTGALLQSASNAVLAGRLWLTVHGAKPGFYFPTDTD